MDLANIDWNLVPALDALLTERNVSRAARRLGVSQPAASKALARLRRLYGDELLVRRGNTFTLTPLAERLAPAARRAVGAARSVVAPDGELTPAELTRSFTIAASDYAQAVLAPAVADAVAAIAPGVQVNFVEPFAVASGDDDVLPQVDGWIGPREMFADRPHEGRLRDEWACLTSTGQPDADGALTLGDLARRPWVVPTVSGRRLILQLDGLRAHGVEATVLMTTDSFIAVPFLVGGTDRIGLLQRRLGALLAAAAGVRVQRCPWAVPPLEFTLWYDASRQADPVHRWLRAVVASCMADLDGA